MSSKLQDYLHWLLVVALTLEAVAPAVNQLLSSGHLSGLILVNGVVGLLSAIALKFVYYATTVQGTTPQV